MFPLLILSITSKVKQSKMVCTLLLTPPVEECDEEIISFDEFVNKMRSYNELASGAPWPQDPYEHSYKILVNNTFKPVHLINAYEAIDVKLADYIADNWNEGVPTEGVPTEGNVDARMNAIFNQTAFNDDIKNILLEGIDESVDDVESVDDDE